MEASNVFHCIPHYAVYSNFLCYHFLGLLELFLGCDITSYGLILLRFWTCVVMILAGKVVFRSTYFGGLFLLVIIMLHCTSSLLPFCTQI